MMNNTELAKALTVMVTDPKIRSFLEDNDPMALKQATEALRNHFNKVEEVNWSPCPTDYIPTGLSAICDGRFWELTEPLKWGSYSQGGSTPLAK